MAILECASSQSIALRGSWNCNRLCRILVRIDHQNSHAAGMIPQALGVQMQARRGGWSRLKHCGSHEPPPQERRPIVWAWLVCVLVEQGIVAGCKGIVHVNLDSAFGQNSQLIQIAEAVEEG